MPAPACGWAIELAAAVTPWPYPRWLAHRGAGKLAPENTLAAFRLGAGLGYTAFECDVKLSADGIPFLLHDDALDRTSNGTGTASALPWAELSQLDAGSWHSRSFAGEPLPTLQAVAAFVLRNGSSLNIEIKPTLGADVSTGQRVAALANRLWAGHQVPPLLSSFRPEALAAAQAAAPALPRALLLDTLWPGWFECATALGCVAVVSQHGLMNTELLKRLRAAGWRALVYTVNDATDAERLLALGVDGLITDNLTGFAPATG